MPMELTIYSPRETHGYGESASLESELVHQFDVGHGDCHGSGRDLGSPIDGENHLGPQRRPRISSRQLSKPCT